MRVTVDPEGKILLPRELNPHWRLAPGDELVLAPTPDGLLITKPEEGCLFCNAAMQLVRMGGHCVCLRCIRRLAAAQEGDFLYCQQVD